MKLGLHKAALIQYSLMLEFTFHIPPFPCLPSWDVKSFQFIKHLGHLHHVFDGNHQSEPLRASSCLVQHLSYPVAIVLSPGGQGRPLEEALMVQMPLLAPGAHSG